MFPTMGDPGSEVKFTRDNLQECDIYFISDINKPSLYVESNRAENFEMVTNPSEDDVITATVPNVTPGPYYVVFTNPKSQTVGVVARYILPQQYTVINVSQQPKISNVEPNSTPSQADTPIAINGYYLASKNLPGFATTAIPKCTFIEDSSTGVNIASMDYGSGTLTTGGKSYSVKVTRTYEVFIGRKLSIEDFIFDPGNDNTINTIKVKTPVFITEQAEVQPVMIRMQTTITGEFNSVLVKQVIWTDPSGKPYDFTYLPSSEKPQVTQVIPGIIPIEQQNNQYFINSSINELQIAIKGSNFLVTRYPDASGEEQINYPKVSIGGVVINNNVNPGTDYQPLSFEVLKGNVVVDGTGSNQIGDTILIRVAAGTAGINISDKNNRSVVITNPIRNSANFSVSYPFPEMVVFELINENDYPIISSVTPNLVAVQGGTNVLVSGSNLRTGASVYIDGKLVTNIKVSSDNKSIQFTAPAGREGETLLQVQNPGGGIATYPFIYTTTYTDPKIISIQPPKGTTGTAVTVIGDAFLQPDATVAVDSINDINQYLIYRLIGTRILMNGYDINEYNLVGNRIQLTPYFNNGVRNIKEDVFVYRNYGQMELGKGFNSVILYDGAKKFYRLSKNIKNQFAIEGRQKIGDTIERTRYEINYDNNTGEFTATLNGKLYKVSQNKKGTIQILDGSTVILDLSAYTPYLIEKVGGYDEITGNRVFITDPLDGATNSADKLVFEVPDLSQGPWTGNGLYDVTVINPDTKAVTKTKAFEYFSHSVVIPWVVNVEPAQGPDSGGNVVKLTGPQVPADYANLLKDYQRIGFVNTAGEKTRVFIGSKEASPADVIISPDGKELSFKVPAYGENLAADLIDRITAAIVLVNPDGGTFSITYNQPLITGNKAIYGYTYIKPTSNPRIVSISPQEGPAKGGYIVEIFGTDFRDFIQDGDVTQKADLTKTEESNYDKKYRYLSDPLLPSIYFGNSKAELLEYNTGYLQVLIPPGSGTVNVFAVNNDAGISNSVKFKYLLSSPKITSISPGVGKKQGGYKVDIEGTGFDKSMVNILSGDNVETETEMAIIKVGNITNKDLPRSDANAGVILSSHATVTLAGGLVVRYNAGEKKLTVTIADFNQEYTHEYDWDGEKTVFVNTTDLQTTAGDVFPYSQLIYLQIAENRLLADAGYAPAVSYHNSNLLEVTMPGYYTVGKVPLTIINPDGGTASSTFEFKNPDSHPTITNLSRDSQYPESEKVTINGSLVTVKVLRINYQGKSVVSVIGTDFREKATIQIGDIVTIQPKDITYTLPTKLTFTVPAIDEKQVGKFFKVVVINEDGGTAASDQMTVPEDRIFIQFTKGETAPEVSAVTPAIGPVTGGTVVKIEGKDFRAKVEGYDKPLTVYFGESQVNSADIKVIDYKTIRVLTPTHLPGKVEVRIENPDGEISATTGAFTYISNPKITALVDSLDASESTRIDNISVEGGQIIKIKGSGFMEGARVVFNPVTKAASDTSTNVIYRVTTKQVDSLTSNALDPYTLESGTDGTEVKFIDSQTLTVKTPSGKVDTGGIVVINPDKGASETFNDLVYELPEAEAPQGVVAEIIRDRYNDTDRSIKVNWTAVTGATEYEVYVVADGQSEYIGSTALTSFVYEDLQPDTTYKFIVKTIGNFGASKPSLESNKVKTGDTVGPPDDDGTLNEKTQMVKQGTMAMVNIGTDDFKDKTTVDLTRGTLAGCKELVISIPAKVVASSKARDVAVCGPDYSITFNPQIFNISSMNENHNKPEAGVRFKIAPYTASLNLVGGNNLSTPYTLEALAFVGQNNTSLDYLNGNMDFLLDYDTSKAGLRRLSNITMNRYSQSSNIWEPVSYGNTTLGNAIKGSIGRLGCYVIMGRR
ncbi:MAG: IPT/TIG domain-containing protein, partial [Syntrophomonas sp.]